MAIGLAHLVRLSPYEHAPARAHVDPPEEVFPSMSMVFTLGGDWSYRSARGSVTLDPDTVLLANAGEAYTCAHPSRFPTDRNLWLEFDASVPALLGGGTFEPVAIPLTRSLRATLRELVRAQDGVRRESLALHAAADVLRFPRPPGAKPVDGDLDAARAYIDEHFDEDLSLAAIAARASLSPFHLGRSFKARFGLSPYRYLIERRVMEARRLLAGSDMTVTEIALAAGFTTPAHFSTTFRRATGRSPRAYRYETAGRASRGSRASTGPR